MKTVMKKLLSLMLVAVLLVSAVPFQASATETEATDDITAVEVMSSGRDEDVAAEGEGVAAAAATYGTLYVSVYEVDKDDNAVWLKDVKFQGEEEYALNEALIKKCYSGNYKEWKWQGSGSPVDMTEGDVNVNLLITPLKTPGNKAPITLTLMHNDGTSNRETIQMLAGDEILDAVKKADIDISRKGYKLAGWSFDMNCTEDIGRDDVAKEDMTIYAEWESTGSNEADDDWYTDSDDDYYVDDFEGDASDYVTVVLDLNYSGSKDKYVKGLEPDDKMGVVLEKVDDPSRSGYTFEGWYWDDDYDYKVKDNEYVGGKAGDYIRIYAKWNKKDSTPDVMLRIYINGKTSSAAKIVDMDNYADDGKITRDEVKTVVKKYYTAADNDGLTYHGLFTTDTWDKGDYDVDDAVSSVKVDKDDDTYIYVMVKNVKVSSNSAADPSNPKTGDQIFMTVTVMAVSASALALFFFLNKKRAAK